MGQVNDSLERRPHLREQLESLPTKPGVYLMKDEQGEIIYVGKASTLRSRVRSYFHASAEHSPRTRRLAQVIHDLEFIVTDSEVEALILENTLIKRHQPRYNVRFKDDKRYPYVKITWQEPFPRVFSTRRMIQDGARYFGPYTSVQALHQTLDLLRKIFPYRTCTRRITGDDSRPCLYYYIDRCAAPCIGAVSQEEYREMIEQVCLFLEGKVEPIVADLRAKMQAASDELDFERAARLRDQLQAIGQVTQRQKVVSPAGGDQDVIGLARADSGACAQVFFIRQGKLIGREYFLLEGTEEEGEREVITSFVKQFYDQAAYVPPEILLPHEVEGAPVIERWLRDKREAKAILKVPHQGMGRELVEMAAENAVEMLTHLQGQWRMGEERSVQALTQLQEALGLPQPPTRIEGYDISTIQGVQTTGSMVVFVKGKPRKSDYRRFRIRSVEGVDDYAALQEVLERRFRRVAIEEELTERPGREKSSWSILPNLILIDGGKGQLRAAQEILSGHGLDHLAVASLAKREEELFVPEQMEPVGLERGSPALLLVQRVRDEAHRFAVSYHRTLRRKSGVSSILEEIPHIGPKRRQALLKTFGSLEAIRQASTEELAAVSGMTQRAAEQVKANL
ncbi:MAG: excinuclease ABC subunit UvrC [Chloroflexota bacterium]|nr:excinuclease ABC subunit UvrC [Chloroflexota bacterium]